MQYSKRTLVAGGAALFIGCVPLALAETVRDAETASPRESEMAKPDDEASNPKAASEKLEDRRAISKRVDGEVIELDEGAIVNSGV